MKKEILSVIFAILTALLLSCNNDSAEKNNKKETLDEKEESTITKDTSQTESSNVDSLEFEPIPVKEVVHLTNPQEIISYFKEENGQYSFYIDTYNTGKTNKIGTFEDKPLDVLWDFESGDIYFVFDKSVYKGNIYEESKTAIKIAPTPPIDLTYGFMESWIDAKTKNICIAYMYYVKEEDQEHYEELVALQDDFTSDGSPVIVGIIQSDTEGKWTTLVEVPTSFKPYGGYIYEVDEYINKSEEMKSSKEQANLCTKYGTENSQMIFGEDSKKILNGKLLLDEAVISIVEINAVHRILATVQWGDTPHFVPPIYIKKIETGEVSELNLKNTSGEYKFDAVAIQITYNHIIISEEYSNTNALVFDVNSLELIKEYSNCEYVIEF